MKKILSTVIGVCAVAVAVAGCSSAADTSAGPSASFDVGTAAPETPLDPSTVTAARGEGPLLIYGNANDSQMQPLIAGFRSKYPDITVQYLSLGGPETFQRYLSEKATGGKTADLIMESNGPLWTNFVKEGEIEDYQDPNLANLPSYVNLLPGVTAMSMDPLVAVFNKALLPVDQQPTSLKGLAAISDELNGRIGTYVIENALGYEGTYAYTDEGGSDAWDTLNQIGPNAKAESSSGTMLTKLMQGAYTVAYNMSGATRALAMTQNADVLNFRYLTDNTPLIPRAMGITKGASSPNAAKVFYNYALSVGGQTAGCEGGFTPFRDGVDCKFGVPAIRAEVGEENLIFGTYEPGLIDSQTEIVSRWNGLFGR